MKFRCISGDKIRNIEGINIIDVFYRLFGTSVNITAYIDGESAEINSNGKQYHIEKGE